MRLLGPIFAAIILASPVIAQNPDDVSFVLATQSGKTTFRLGEQIDLEFRFASGTSSRYEVAPCYPSRRFVGTSPDVFIVDPDRGTADPLADIPAQISGMPCVGVPLFLGPTPIVRNRILNEWVEFHRPGRYRITATTHQIVDAQSHVPLRRCLHSWRSGTRRLHRDRRGRSKEEFLRKTVCASRILSGFESKYAPSHSER